MESLIRSGQKRFVWCGSVVVERDATVYVAGDVTVYLHRGASAVLYLRRCSGAVIYALPKTCVTTRGFSKEPVIIRVKGGRLCTVWEINPEGENEKSNDGNSVVEKTWVRGEGRGP